MHNLSKKKKALCSGVNVFSTKVLIEDNIFTSSTGRGTAIFESSETREGLAVCKAKAVPSFLGYVRVGPTPGIEPETSPSAVKCSTD